MKKLLILLVVVSFLVFTLVGSNCFTPTTPAALAALKASRPPHRQTVQDHEVERFLLMGTHLEVANCLVEIQAFDESAVRHTLYLPPCLVDELLKTDKNELVKGIAKDGIQDAFKAHLFNEDFNPAESATYSIITFGLQTLYKSEVKKIYTKCKREGIELIFVGPIMVINQDCQRLHYLYLS